MGTVISACCERAITVLDREELKISDKDYEMHHALRAKTVRWFL